MNDSIPFLAVGNDELRGQPRVRVGESILCPHCDETHKLLGGKDDKGAPSDLLLTYYCGWRLYLAAINGRLLPSIREEL